MFSETDNNYPCPFPDCALSAEEHHRVSKGLAAERDALKARLRQPETVDLSTISNDELIKELASRL